MMRTEHASNPCVQHAYDMPAMRGNGRTDGRTDGDTHPAATTADALTRTRAYANFDETAAAQTAHTPPEPTP